MINLFVMNKPAKFKIIDALNGIVPTRKYSMVIVCAPYMTGEDMEGLVSVIVAAVRHAGGSVYSSEYCGLKDLEYKINRYSTAHYQDMQISLLPSGVLEIDSILKKYGGIMRYVIKKISEFYNGVSPIITRSKRIEMFNIANLNRESDVEQDEGQIDQVISSPYIS